MHSNQSLVDALQSASKAFRQSRQSSDVWAVFYAHHLLTQTHFQLATDRDWTEEELAEALMHLKTAYGLRRPKEHWSVYYAQRLSQ